MTKITVDPAKLHGIASSVASDYSTVEACATASKTARHDTTVGVGSHGDAFATLARATDDMCRAAKTWFAICADSVATLAKDASGAADSYKHVDHAEYVRGPGGKPLLAPT